ncbi:hypothetical protein ACWD6I_01980 [Streptomyces sp. NPDC002454]|uniref:hypothetical protein n=1 Tax=Streptomyces sp. NPDC049906 TaxID=3155656 RepID=UPI0034243DA6
MGMWRDKTPRKGDEVTRPDPGPINPAGTAPGMWGRGGRRPGQSPAGAHHACHRRNKPKAS